MKAIIVLSLLTVVLMLFLIIKFPKIKLGKLEVESFWLVPTLSALIILIFGLLPIDKAVAGLTADTSINPIKIIVLFFSMTFISIVLDEIGFFEYLAKAALDKCKTNQMVLFLGLYFLTAILTIFTSNDIIVLTFTPFIVFFTKNAKINPIPYLVAEFVAANTWSIIFIIGNPTNIYLATSHSIDFIEYFLVMAIPTIMSGIALTVTLFVVFRKELKKPIVPVNNTTKIKNKFLFICAITCLGLCTALLIISSYISLEMYLISLVFALILLIILSLYSIIKKDYSYLKGSIKRIPYSLAPFIISMFVIVLSLEHVNITTYLTSLLDNDYPILTYGVTSTLVCNFINNIPMSVLYSKIIPVGNLKALYATIIGSNIGAYLTPIGALAGIMWLSILKKYDVKYNMLTFIKYGIITVIPALLFALLGLALVL